jgi:hypothetical protein
MRERERKERMEKNEKHTIKQQVYFPTYQMLK